MNQVTEILVLSANPKNTSRLRLDEEVREIEEGLKRSRKRDQFRIHSRWATRLKDLRRALLDHEPHIVHFCGHGDTNGVVVENDDGNAIRVKPKAIAGLFELFIDKVACVLLNACYSKVQANEIKKHIEYVIGMKKEITDEASLEFSLGFYDALGAGKSIEEAFKFGRNAIQLYHISEYLTPILLKRTSVRSILFLQGSRDHIFRFRAECEHDANEFRKTLGDQIKRIVKINESPFPDTEVEISVSLSFEELRDAMRKVEDGHVMVQTVALKDKYTGERDYDL